MGRRKKADALVQGAAIKRQYNTMKRLSYWLSALGVMATTLAGYSVHKQVKQAKEYDTLLQQTVSALPVSHLQNARSVYANSIIQQMNKNPQMGVVEATETALSQVNSQSTTHMLPAVSRIVAQDVMALAEAYEDMGVPKQNYFNVMVGYSKDTSGVYAQRLSSPELVKDRVLYHLQNSYTR